MFDLFGSVQSFVFDMAQSEEPDRKRAQFSKVNGDFWQK